MDKINITSDKGTMSAKNMRLVITLEQKLDVSECYECGRSSSKIRQDVGIPESKVWNITKYAREI
jgi:hypothetical protein